MAKASKISDDYSASLEVAMLRFKDWVKDQNLSWRQINSSRGLSKSTVQRFWQVCPERSKNEWLLQISRLFKRIKDLGKSTASWADVLGSDFPPDPKAEPSLSPYDSNYADVALVQLRKDSFALIEYFETEYRKAYLQENIWKASQFLVRLCGLYEITEQWEEAAPYFALLADLNARTGDFHYVADSLLRQGLSIFYAGNQYEKAKILFKRGLDVISEHSDKTPPYRTELRLRNYLALTEAELGNEKVARTQLESVNLPMAKNRASTAAVASVQNRLGKICLRLNDRVAASNYLLAALETRLTLKMRSEALRTLCLLAQLHEKEGELPQAILLWRIAAEGQKTLTDEESLAQTYLEMGRRYVALHRSASWSTSTSISVSPEAESFRNPCELKLIKSIGEWIDQTRNLRLHRDKLIDDARQIFNQALHWDHKNNTVKVTQLVEKELAALKGKPNSRIRRRRIPGSRVSRKVWAVEGSSSRPSRS